jgi:RNA polymerase sigma-70 factor (ECF subfamily)
MKNMTDKNTDEELAAIMQSGVGEAVDSALTVLIGRYEKKMQRYATKFLYTYEDAQDAVQEVFIKVYKNIQSFDTEQRFSPWIYRIAHNTFINVIKKHKREKLASFDVDTFFSWNLSDEYEANRHEQKLDRNMLDHCLGEIDVKYREPLVLYYFEEKDYKEIADILQSPVATVGVRLRRGREQMKKIYDKFNT